MKKLILFIVLVYPTFLFGQLKYSEVELKVDFSGKSMLYSNYWNSTGFSPADLLLRKDMQLTLDYLCSVPNEGIKYIRPHWMLNLVGSRNVGTNKAEYNFEKLDAALDELISRDLKPIFEIMGFPNLEWIVPENRYDKYAQGQENEVEQWTPDFDKKEDYKLWYEFVKVLITHIEKRYGEEELKEWYFECTNEPDIINNFWKQQTPALLNYWDATSEAIKSVDKEYKIGGPGNARGVNEVFKAFIAHCDTGKNVITKKRGAPLDFISVHRKARPYLMVEVESECVNYIRDNHPRFSALPFWNDEADPIGGWGIPYWWRSDAWYGSCIAHAVDVHNRLSIDSLGVSFGMLSNDNGFMGSWYHRTHLARYSNPDDIDKFWLFKQTDLSVMSLLALCTGNRFYVKGYNNANKETTVVIPSRNENGDIILLVVNKPEFGILNPLKTEQQHILPEQYKSLSSQGTIVNIDLANIDLSGFDLAHIRIDNSHGNSYTTWTALGQPESITSEQYKMIVANQEPVIIEKTEADPKIRLIMPPSSISMIVLSKEKDVPANPQIVSVKEYSGYNGEKAEFVRWQQITSQIVTYDLFASYNGSDFIKVNPQPLFDCGFLNVLSENEGKVEYKVIANKL